MLSQPNELQSNIDTFSAAITRAASRQLSIVELISCATAIGSSGQKPQVIELYKTWIAYNSGDPLLHAAYFNYAIALNESGDRAGAINAFQACLRIKPDFYPAYINLGRVLEDSGQTGSAVAQWLALVQNLSAVNGESVSHKLIALEQIGRVLEAGNDDTHAEDALKQSIEINPHQSQIIQHFISLRQRQCKWPAIVGWDRITRPALVKHISSLSLAYLADDPMLQLAKGYDYAKQSIGRPKPVQRPASARRADPLRLKIGYVSSDLRDHAVGFAMTDVMEQHDHEKFEIFAYYCGINRPDATQARIKAAVDHWTDINGMSDDAAAAKIAADDIDILVDLNGYTKDARTKVFARRPAPVIVNWFGYPNSMGTPYHHYLIADDFVVPTGDDIYYSEKIVRLPCYQPNDRRRPVAEHRQTRAEAGLPEQGFVFCSFNGMQKLTAAVYQRWLTILGRVPGSVLWLLTGTADTNERLRKVAAEAGIAPERIVFADKKANPDHLARYPLADLFLDSFPYGAHTTASDAMWMGVPILTLYGRTFASRVCADLARAAGIGEMACATPEEYVERAVAYGNDPGSLMAIKTRLASGRDTCLLFDTPKLVRHLEDAYRQMWSDLIRDAVPTPDLRNLDIYHEIGLDLDLENIETLNDAAYVSLYRQKLADWHEAYPIEHDNRLWRSSAAEVTSLDERRAVA